jgi:hypothetical protein
MQRYQQLTYMIEEYDFHQHFVPITSNMYYKLSLWKHIRR